MAQYKVPQNVEAEDKILGPLTIRQFIYVIIGVAWAFIIWKLFGNAIPIAVVLIVPVTGTFLALGLVQREGQSFENYFVALIRYFFMPRQLVWQKETAIHRAAIKAPPKKKEAPKRQRDPAEIRGQLKKLALIIDTRGQTKKDEDIQLADDQNQAAELSKRVTGPKPEPVVAESTARLVTDQDDVLNPQSDKAAGVGHLLENVETDIRAQAKAAMVQSLSRAGHPKIGHATAPPISSTNQAVTASNPSQGVIQNDILKMAMQNEALSVAQLANQANRQATLTEGQSVQLRS